MALASDKHNKYQHEEVDLKWQKLNMKNLVLMKKVNRFM